MNQKLTHDIKNYIKKINAKISKYNSIKYYLDQKYNDNNNYKLFDIIDKAINDLTFEYIHNVKNCVREDLYKLCELHEENLYLKITEFKINLMQLIISYEKINHVITGCTHLNLFKCCFACYCERNKDLSEFDKDILTSMFLNIREFSNENSLITSSNILNSDFLKLYFYILDESVIVNLSKLKTLNNA